MTSLPKGKEIYKYNAPWTVYSMNWCQKPEKRFKLALGSFIEDYNNLVSPEASKCPRRIQNERTFEFRTDPNKFTHSINFMI